MPLMRGQNIVFETVKGIHFLMRDPNTREFIACLITHQALIDSGATHEPRPAPMQVFDVHRSEIEGTASDRWDRGEVDGHHIIHISTAQFREAEPIDATLVPRPGGGPKKDSGEPGSPKTFCIGLPCAVPPNIPARGEKSHTQRICVH